MVDINLEIGGSAVELYFRAYPKSIKDWWDTNIKGDGFEYLLKEGIEEFQFLEEQDPQARRNMMERDIPEEFKIFDIEKEWYSQPGFDGGTSFVMDGTTIKVSIGKYKTEVEAEDWDKIFTIKSSVEDPGDGNVFFVMEAQEKGGCSCSNEKDVAPSNDEEFMAVLKNITIYITKIGEHSLVDSIEYEGDKICDLIPEGRTTSLFSYWVA